MNAPYLIAVLVTIGVPLVAIYLIYASDLFGTGKLSTFVLSALWGALGAYLIADVVNNRVLLPRLGYETVVGLAGPIVEEIAKALLLIYLVTRPRFKYAVDGAGYGVAIGAGFSVSENLLRYLILNQNAPIVGALSRVFSTMLIHATASALVGISLGRLRRSQGRGRWYWPAAGVVLAIILHVVYNNIVGTLSGPALLFVAIGIGAVGLGIILFLVRQGLALEKEHFAETLGIAIGVTDYERRAVQQFGGAALEKILAELGDYFGDEKVPHIRRLLVIQANMGIVQNNLRSPASERLRAAWQEELQGYRAEIDVLRKRIGLYTMTYIRNVFPDPEVDATWSEAIGKDVGRADPTQVHTFDIFLRVGTIAGTLSPEELERTAVELQHAAIFKGVSLADLENLSRAITVVTLQDGELLFDEGEFGDTMYLVRAGQIDLFKRDPDGGEKPLRACQPGEVVGELALIDGSPRSAGARAHGVTTALRLRGQHFMSFISSRPQVVLAVLRFLADRVRHTTTVLEETIVRAVQLTHGTVTESAAPAAMLGASAVWSIPTAPTQPAAQEHAPVVAGDVPLSLTGAFAKIAATLDQRTGDQERKQANGAERPARDREPTTRLWTRLGRDGEDKDTGDDKKDVEKD